MKTVDGSSSPTLPSPGPARFAAPVAILGVPFDNVTVPEAISRIEEMVASGRPHYLATANIDFLVQSLRDIELRRILCEADLVICDGTPLVWASRWLGNPLPERVAGSDLVPLLVKTAAEKGYRIFFLGGSPETARQAVKKLEAENPRLKVAGHYSPLFSPLLEMDHEQIVRRIHEARPDLLFVCFGCPKQEKWIAMHYRTLGVPVAVGVGGTIDFLAGRLARAPQWMQRSGLEWLYRVWQEPGRLARRYLYDLISFGGPFLEQLWQLQFRRGRAPLPLNCPRIQEKLFCEIHCPDWLNMDQVQKSAALWEQALATHRHCLLDASRVQFIDSTGLGLLIRLQKRARKAGKQLILLSPSQRVRRALSTMRLIDFFRIETDEARARRQLDEMNLEKPAMVQSDPEADSAIVWQGEVTAVNASQVWDVTESALRSSRQEAFMVVDLKEVHFIDSTGLGLMVRAKKEARQRGIELRFRSPQSAVLNVIRISKLQSYLLGESHP